MSLYDFQLTENIVVRKMGIVYDIKPRITYVNFMSVDKQKAFTEPQQCWLFHL